MRLSPLRAPRASAGAVKSLSPLLFLPLVILFCASSARAIPITITGGSIGTPGRVGNFSAGLTGIGFQYVATDFGAPRHQICGLCAPGSNFPATLQVRLPSTGVLTYNGVTYGPGSGVVASNLVISLPPFTIPTDLSPVSTTFTMSGTVSATPHGGSLITFEVTGSGTVTFTFGQNSGGGFTLGATHFNFSPPAAVPEPATMILLGTGLAGVAAKVRRRRRGGAPPA